MASWPMNLLDPLWRKIASVGIFALPALTTIRMKIHNKVVIMQDKFETTLHEVSIKQTEKQEDVMDGIGIALTEIEKSLTDIKKKTVKEDRPIPSPYLLPSPKPSLSVYKPFEKPITKKFPRFFPPEGPMPESSKRMMKTLSAWSALGDLHMNQFFHIPRSSRDVSDLQVAQGIVCCARSLNAHDKL